MAGWTALQFPWVDRPISDEGKAMANSHDLPPPLEGMNVEALKELFTSLTFSSEYGYNVDTDYRKPDMGSHSPSHDLKVTSNM
jgi:hypothetical protein